MAKKRYSDEEFSLGVTNEMDEHRGTIRAFFPQATEDDVRKIAASIAEDHLNENPNYYSELLRYVEKE